MNEPLNEEELELVASLTQEEAERLYEALRFIRAEARSVRKGMRRARPTPRESMQAALIIIERVAANALGENDPLVRWPSEGGADA